MSTRSVPAVYARGGTSKALLFHASDLPADPSRRDAVLLAAMGSPDPYGRQLDGMGGGASSTSKVALIGPSARQDADVDYTFGQVAVDRAEVDWSGNCGNVSSAVGPFAVDEGLCARPDGATQVRIFNTNTGKVIVSRFAVAGGRAVVDGTASVPGVVGTGAPIRLEFLDPAGAGTGALLPTGSVSDVLDVPFVGEVRVSLVDAVKPVVFVPAAAFGLTGAEAPADLDGRVDLLTALEAVRRCAAVRMGLAARSATVSPATPKIALVGGPRPFVDLTGRRIEVPEHVVGVRMLSLGMTHRAISVTTALCASVAVALGSVVTDLATARDDAGPSGDGRRHLRIGTPSGVVAVSSSVTRTADGWLVRDAAVDRTSRPLMRGEVIVSK